MRNRGVAFAGLLVLSASSGAWISAEVNQPQQAGPIYTVGFVQVPAGGEADYVQMERGVFKPIHEARIRAGELEEWHLYAVESRDEGAAPYGYVVINVYESPAQREASRRSQTDFLAEVHPGMSEEQLRRQMEAARVIAPHETWRLLESAN